MPTQAERSATTRGRIIDAARSLFVTNGYDATTVADVIETAGVSKGALYHHFDSKRSIAEAVFAQTSRDAIVAASRRSVDDADPVEALAQRCLSWLDEVSEPSVAAVMFDVGPTALGWERCRELETPHSLRALTQGITRSIDGRDLSPARVRLAALTINAVLAELAWLSASDNEAIDHEDAESVVRATVDALVGIVQPAA